MTRGADDFSWLPALLAEIAGVAGPDAAIAIARARGGTDVHFPARAPDGHWLVETVGREAADKICNHFRAGGKGMTLRLPLGPAGTLAGMRSAADRMILEGRLSNGAIAKALGYTISAVEKRRKKLREGSQPTGAQCDLFEGMPPAVAGEQTQPPKQ